MPDTNVPTSDKIRNDGGDAFPSTPAIAPSGDVYQPWPGMTMRDYFAAQALAGFCSNSDVLMSLTVNGGINHYRLAEGAYLTADAMIRERAK